MEGKTARGGLPYWGPLGTFDKHAPRALARSVLSLTDRLGSRFACLTGNSNSVTFEVFGL